MKQLLLSIFCISYIYAQTTQHDICQFKKVIKNGWSDDNTTLNRKIIDLGKVEIPRIVENLEYPLKADENKSAIIKIPKLILTRDDYIVLISYTKYLESHNQIAKAIKIYISSFEGLSNMTDTSMLSTIFRLVINNILIDSLNQSLKKKAITQEDKQYLYKKLSRLLILNNYYIVEGIKSEKNINFRLINQIQEEKYNEKYIKIYKQEFQKLNRTYWDTLINAIKTNNLLKTQKIEEEELSRLLFWNRIKLFLLDRKINFYKKLSIMIDKKDYITHAKYSALNTVLVIRPKLYETCQDYLNMIDRNKKLLQRLKEEQ